MTNVPDNRSQEPSASGFPPPAFESTFNQLLLEIEPVIKGKRDQVAMALVCVLAEGHLLLEDVPIGQRDIVAVSETYGSGGMKTVTLVAEGQEVFATVVLKPVGGVAGKVTKANTS